MKKHDMTSEPRLRNKFIAFVDILGFRSKVEEVEKDGGLQLADLLEYCSDLSQPLHVQDISKYGPIICPESRYESRNLDYMVTQVSDCVVVSAEVSPAGIINLLQHVSACAFGLMTKGVMVRGYICRGNIFHTGNQFVGTGYQAAHKKEGEVRAFRLPLDKTSTPFVEIDPVVVNYIKNKTCQCVLNMFGRISKEDEHGITVIDPFRRLSFLAGQNVTNTEECVKSLNVIRKWIENFAENLDSQSLRSDTGGKQKVKYYKKFLRDQLDTCDTIERSLELLKQPAVKLRFDGRLNTVWDS